MIAAASPSINALDVLGSTSDINMKGNGGRARNALHIAAIVNQSQNVSLILKAGVNVHATAEGGITPLCLAFESLYTITRSSGEWSFSGEGTGWTALNAATVRRHEEVVQTLAQAMRRPNA
ncbi:MAG: hypothetical protein ASARMPREDX12_002730 [Alectoria sarmentosa]|nr:MAG: hypothetical protein ASARMPREDX12_002730 [Alectoria sarmentosa]